MVLHCTTLLSDMNKDVKAQDEKIDDGNKKFDSVRENDEGDDGDGKVGSNGENDEGDNNDVNVAVRERESVVEETEDDALGLDNISDMSTKQGTEQPTQLTVPVSVSDLSPVRGKEVETKQDDISIPSAEYLYQQQFRVLLPLAGDYVMGVLEMFKYGLYIDKAPQEAARRVDLTIKFLESKGIRSCESLMTEMALDFASVVTDMMLGRVLTIVVLDVKNLEALKSGIV
ncbi:hypothetical protein BGZ47_004873 [Haplosporangium gracile]|nr:hypothetical protein BGZ47_004873 [Haplosporangium gracile]